MFLPGLASDHDPPTYASSAAGIMDACLHAWLNLKISKDWMN
jgi:hypothetical protein